MSAAAISGSAVPGTDHVSVRYLDSCGTVVRAALSISSQVRFESLPPVQQLPTYKGQRNFPGLWWMATTRSHVGFDSWRKRDQLIALDFDPRVTAVALRPMALVFEAQDDVLEHCPDYFARLADGTGVVLDVRDDAKRSNLPSFVPAAADRVGWEYRIPSAIGPVRMANLRWLAGYRHPRCVDASRVAELLEVFATPRPLAAGIAGLGDRIAVLPTLFHLLWRGVLGAELDARVLGDDTLVTTRARVRS